MLIQMVTEKLDGIYNAQRDWMTHNIRLISIETEKNATKREKIGWGGGSKSLQYTFGFECISYNALLLQNEF